MAVGNVNVGQELLNVPMGEMISSMALAIADAQWQLDKSSVVVTELMSGQRLLRDLDSGVLMDADGKATGIPTVIDSRVYFGYEYDSGGNKIPQKLSMMELGFVPNFYQFVDTIIEVKIAVSVRGETEQSTEISNSNSSSSSSSSSNGTRYWWWGGYNSNRHSRTVTARTSSVDANYSSKYSYSVEGASLLRTKMVPVPPPSILEERVRQLIELEAVYAAEKISSST